MNKAELIGKIAEDAGITRAAAATAHEQLHRGHHPLVEEGACVTLVGFGTFGVNKRKARTGRNPQTGEDDQDQGEEAVRFKAGKQLVDWLNK